jgi:hypothetical protein
MKVKKIIAKKRGFVGERINILKVIFNSIIIYIAQQGCKY